MAQLRLFLLVDIQFPQGRKRSSEGEGQREPHKNTASAPFSSSSPAGENLNPKEPDSSTNGGRGGRRGIHSSRKASACWCFLSLSWRWASHPLPASLPVVRAQHDELRWMGEYRYKCVRGVQPVPLVRNSVDEQ